MKVNGSIKSTADGRRGKPLQKFFAAALLLAFVFASLPMGSASAAPLGPGNQDAWDRKVENLQAEMAMLNTLVTQPGKFGNSEEQARYRDRYIATMRAAQALLVNPGGAAIPVTGGNNANNNGDDNSGNNNGNNNSGGYYQKHPEKLMALYLHQMRKLREKMEVTSKNATTNNNNNGGPGTGTGTGTTTPTAGAPGEARKALEWVRSSLSSSARIRADRKRLVAILKLDRGVLCRTQNAR